MIWTFRGLAPGGGKRFSLFNIGPGGGGQTPFIIVDIVDLEVVKLPGLSSNHSPQFSDEVHNESTLALVHCESTSEVGGENYLYLYSKKKVFFTKCL